MIFPKYQDDMRIISRIEDSSVIRDIVKYMEISLVWSKTSYAWERGLEMMEIIK